MKKIIILSCFFLLGISVTAHAYHYEDYKHWEVNAIDCDGCHGQPDWTSPEMALPYLLRNDSTAPTAPDPGTPETCSDCHNDAGSRTASYPSSQLVKTHKHWDEGLTEYVITAACWDCHQNHGSTNVRKVTEEVKVCSDDRSPCKTDSDCATGTCGVSVTYQSLGDFTDVSGQGICQVCHTTTSYWLFDGSGTTHYEGRDCSDCHLHSQGFSSADICGNGIQEGGEACDDGNLNEYDNCLSDCTYQAIQSEICGDGIDNDGDLDTDEGDCITCTDVDTDGYPVESTCLTLGAPAAAADCDDTDPLINMDATEICDGNDNNCDGQIDEGVKDTYYYDYDSDTYGDPNVSADYCTGDNPADYVLDHTDCDDNDPLVNPGLGNCGANAFFPYVIDSGNWVSEIGYMNIGTGTLTSSTLKFYNGADGNEIPTTPSDPTDNFDPEMGTAYDMCGQDFIGSVNISSDQPAAGVVITKNVTDYKNYGAYGAVKPNHTTILPHVNQKAGKWDVEITLSNASVTASNVTIKMYKIEDGSLFNNPPDTVVLPANGQYHTSVSALTGGADFKGYIEIAADQNTGASASMRNTSDGRYSTYGAIQPSTTIYFPHANINWPWGSFINVTNTSNSTANVTLYYYNFDGSLHSSQNTVIGPHQIFSGLLDTLTDGTFNKGSIEIVADQPIAGWHTFNNYDDFRYGANVTRPPSYNIYYPYVVHSGAALENYFMFANTTDTTASNVIVRCYDMSGVEVVTKTIQQLKQADTKKYGNPDPLFARESFPTLLNKACGSGFEGAVWIESDQPLVGYTSFNDYINGGFGAMTHIGDPQ